MKPPAAPDDCGFVRVETYSTGDRITRATWYRCDDLMLIDENEVGCTLRIHRGPTAVTVTCPQGNAAEIAAQTWTKLNRFLLLTMSAKVPADAMEGLLRALATEALNQVEAKLAERLSPKALTSAIEQKVKAIVQEYLEVQASR